MRSRSTDRRASQGFLTMEALIGLSLIMAVFMVIFHLATTMWLQLKVEDDAERLARSAARSDHPPGTSLDSTLYDGHGTAEIRWGDGYVSVRVVAERGRAAAQRVAPRETW